MERNWSAPQTHLLRALFGWTGSLLAGVIIFTWLLTWSFKRREIKLRLENEKDGPI